MKAVAHSELDKREKAVLNAMLPYIKWGNIEASCHPSIQTLAKSCGYTERSVQGAMIELERRGLMRVTEGPPGWKTFTRTLNWRALCALTPAATAEGRAPHPRTGCGGRKDNHCNHCMVPPQLPHPAPEVRAPQPRSHCAQSFHEPTIDPINEQEESVVATHGMDGKSSEATRKLQTRRMLKFHGVQGKNLELLAGCPQVTPELIEREWTRINGSEGVRNTSAVLVRALADQAGIKLGSQQALADMDPAIKRSLLKTQGILEQRRRDAQLAAS